MNISKEIVTVKSYSKLLFSLYCKGINLLPMQEIKNGNFSYTIKKPEGLIKLVKKDNFENHEKYGIKSNEEKFVFDNMLLSLAMNSKNGTKIWDSNKKILKGFIITQIADILWNVYKYYSIGTSLKFPDEIQKLKNNFGVMESNIVLLLKNGILNGVSNENINEWIDEEIMLVSDVKIMMKNLTSFLFNQNLLSSKAYKNLIVDFQ